MPRSSCVSDIGDWVFADFKEDAAGAGGVDEEVEVASGADLNVFGDEASTLGL